MRFPRIIKIHEDQTVRDAVSFNEYQRLALESIKELRESDPILVEAATLSFSTSTIPNQSTVPHSRAEPPVPQAQECTISGFRSSDHAVPKTKDLPEQSCAMIRKFVTDSSSYTFSRIKRRRLVSTSLAESPNAKPGSRYWSHS